MKQIPLIILTLFIVICAGFGISGHWLGLLTIVIIAVAGVAVFSRVLARFALDRKAKLNLVNYFDYETEHSWPDFRAAAARLNAGRKTWTMTANDGLRLEAGYRPGRPDSHDWVILCHGYGDDAPDGMAKYAQPYIEAGWNILTPAARAHGKSEGRYIGMGWPERFDICGWMEKIREFDPEASIVLHGVSMGGATVLNAAGERPQGLRAVVADCAFTGIREEFAAQARALFGLPSFPVLDIASVFAGKWIGTSLKVTSTTGQTAKIQVPVLFVHGAKDTFVPFEMLDQNFSACRAPKAKLVIADAAHANSVFKDPGYGEKVMQFLGRVQCGEDVTSMFEEEPVQQ